MIIALTGVVSDEIARRPQTQKGEVSTKSQRASAKPVRLGVLRLTS